VALPYDPGVPQAPGTTTISALTRVPLFSSLERQDLELVAQISSDAEFAPGVTLIHENEPGRHFFVLLEGEASVRRAGAEINRMGPNDFFGEISLLSDRPTTASVVTATPARIVVITPPDFRELLGGMPLLQMKVIQALADRLPDDFYWQG
jgi:CRP-like cAMP-binding protein